MEHFKDDFMYKIRSAIKEEIQRKDELNRIISRLDFGKDKYQFYIGKNKGPDGIYYDLFMDEALEPLIRRMLAERKVIEQECFL